MEGERVREGKFITSLRTHMVAWKSSGCDIVLTKQWRMGTTACMLNSFRSEGMTRNCSLHKHAQGMREGEGGGGGGGGHKHT